MYRQLNAQSSINTNPIREEVSAGCHRMQRPFPSRYLLNTPDPTLATSNHRHLTTDFPHPLRRLLQETHLQHPHRSPLPKDTKEAYASASYVRRHKSRLRIRDSRRRKKDDDRLHIQYNGAAYRVYKTEMNR